MKSHPSKSLKLLTERMAPEPFKTPPLRGAWALPPPSGDGGGTWAHPRAGGPPVRGPLSSRPLAPWTDSPSPSLPQGPARKVKKEGDPDEEVGV